MHAADGATRDVEITAGTTARRPGNSHAGHNTGYTPTHVIFVELKDGAAPTSSDLGPTVPEV
jgi:hypothetical protein